MASGDPQQQHDSATATQFATAARSGRRCDLRQRRDPGAADTANARSVHPGAGGRALRRGCEKAGALFDGGLGSSGFEELFFAVDQGVDVVGG